MSKNMLENIRAVIFDLDGTLVDSLWMWESIDIEFLTARGLEMPENLKYEIEGISYAQTADYFIRRFNLKDTPQELMKIWNGMAYEKYCKENLPSEADDIFKKADEYYREFMRRDMPDLCKNMMAANMYDWFTIISL